MRHSIGVRKLRVWPIRNLRECVKWLLRLMREKLKISAWISENEKKYAWLGTPWGLLFTSIVEANGRCTDPYVYENRIRDPSVKDDGHHYHTTFYSSSNNNNKNITGHIVFCSSVRKFSVWRMSFLKTMPHLHIVQFFSLRTILTKI